MLTNSRYQTGDTGGTVVCLDERDGPEPAPHTSAITSLSGRDTLLVVRHCFICQPYDVMTALQDVANR